MIYVFVVWCVVMVAIDYKLNKKIVSVVTAFTAPYLFVVIGNRCYGEVIGFYHISDSVILVLIAGLTAIFCGSTLVSLSHNKIIRNLEFDNGGVTNYLKCYSIRGIYRYVIIAEAGMVIRLIRVLKREGLQAIIANDGTVELIGGSFGHLFLSAYPLLPIILIYWLYNKREVKYLMAYLVFCALLTASFVKYHIISMLLFSYLFVSFEDKRYIKKGILALFGLVLTLFIGNYVVDFYVTNRLSMINRSFYALHFWKYVAGSVVHSNQIFTTGINAGQGVMLKVLYCISSLPGMFYYGFTGRTIKWPFHINMDFIASNGEASNVVDFISFMYPSKGKTISIFAFVLVFLFLGVFYQGIYVRALKNKRGYLMPLYILMTFFMFLSFFGNYYILTVSWEILVWSMIIPNLFNKEAKVKIIIQKR